MSGKTAIEIVRRIVSGMKDPRVQDRTRHSLSDVIIIVIMLGNWGV